MNKNCQVSGISFVITDDEVAFLQKIAPTFAGKKFSIPLPTMCPDERMRLRTMHRNEQFLYRNTSVFNQKSIISVYPPSDKTRVVSKPEWFSDDWDPLDYGRDFDFEKNFFPQYFELQCEVPRAATVTVDNENSEYTTGTGYCRNCYLINSSEHCEDCYYSKLLQKCKNVVDCSYAYDSELLYECFNVKNCYDCKWVYNAQTSSECWFCDDLRHCQNCFLCTNLVGKKYYFMNKKCTEEEYKKRLSEFLSNPQNLKKAKDIFVQLRQEKWCKYANIINSEHCTGDFITNSKNCRYCYDMSESEDCRYVQVGVNVKDVFDCSNMYIKPELSYQVLGTIGTFKETLQKYREEMC